MNAEAQRTRRDAERIGLESQEGFAWPAASRAPVASWTAPAKCSDDGAFGRAAVIEKIKAVARAKAAWRFASRRSPRRGQHGNVSTTTRSIPEQLCVLRASAFFPCPA